MPKKRQNFHVALGACLFCSETVDDVEKFGQKITKLDKISKTEISVHYFCMLFASGLCQRGRSEREGLLGFFLDDIKAEVARGKRLKCHFCKKIGATIGCVVSSCRCIFHFGCGRDNNCLSQFFGNYSSYCEDHSPKQTLPARDRLSFRGTAKTTCAICMCGVETRANVDVLRAPCCKNAWFHRKCIQAQASFSGKHFFKCALCNNKDVFQDEMLTFGVYIPDRDAAWETEPNAFQDLLERHSRCDVTECLCEQGREYNKDNSKWEIILCDWCGSQGTHVSCSRLSQSVDDWVCDICNNITQKDAASKVISQNARNSTAHVNNGEPTSQRQWPSLSVQRARCSSDPLQNNSESRIRQTTSRLSMCPLKRKASQSTSKILMSPAPRKIQRNDRKKTSTASSNFSATPQSARKPSKSTSASKLSLTPRNTKTPQSSRTPSKSTSTGKLSLTPSNRKTPQSYRTSSKSTSASKLSLTPSNRMTPQSSRTPSKSTSASKLSLTPSNRKTPQSSRTPSKSTSASKLSLTPSSTKTPQSFRTPSKSTSASKLSLTPSNTKTPQSSRTPSKSTSAGKFSLTPSSTKTSKSARKPLKSTSASILSLTPRNTKVPQSYRTPSKSTSASKLTLTHRNAKTAKSDRKSTKSISTPKLSLTPRNTKTSQSARKPSKSTSIGKLSLTPSNTKTPKSDRKICKSSSTGKLKVSTSSKKTPKCARMPHTSSSASRLPATFSNNNTRIAGKPTKSVCSNNTKAQITRQTRQSKCTSELSTTPGKLDILGINETKLSVDTRLSGQTVPCNGSESQVSLENLASLNSEQVRETKDNRKWFTSFGKRRARNHKRRSTIQNDGTTVPVSLSEASSSVAQVSSISLGHDSGIHSALETTNGSPIKQANQVESPSKSARRRAFTAIENSKQPSLPGTLDYLSPVKFSKRSAPSSEEHRNKRRKLHDTNRLGENHLLNKPMWYQRLMNEDYLTGRALGTQLMANSPIDLLPDPTNASHVQSCEKPSQQSHDRRLPSPADAMPRNKPRGIPLRGLQVVAAFALGHFTGNIAEHSTDQSKCSVDKHVCHYEQQQVDIVDEKHAKMLYDFENSSQVAKQNHVMLKTECSSHQTSDLESSVLTCSDPLNALINDDNEHDAHTSATKPSLASVPNVPALPILKDARELAPVNWHYSASQHESQQSIAVDSSEEDSDIEVLSVHRSEHFSLGYCACGRPHLPMVPPVVVDDVIYLDDSYANP